MYSNRHLIPAKSEFASMLRWAGRFRASSPHFPRHHADIALSQPISSQEMAAAHTHTHTHARSHTHTHGSHTPSKSSHLVGPDIRADAPRSRLLRFRLDPELDALAIETTTRAAKSRCARIGPQAPTPPPRGEECCLVTDVGSCAHVFNGGQTDTCQIMTGLTLSVSPSCLGVSRGDPKTPQTGIRQSERNGHSTSDKQPTKHPKVHSDQRPTDSTGYHADSSTTSMSTDTPQACTLTDTPANKHLNSRT